MALPPLLQRHQADPERRVQDDMPPTRLDTLPAASAHRVPRAAPQVDTRCLPSLSPSPPRWADPASSVGRGLFGFLRCPDGDELVAVGSKPDSRAVAADSEWRCCNMSCRNGSRRTPNLGRYHCAKCLYDLCQQCYKLWACDPNRNRRGWKDEGASAPVSCEDFAATMRSLHLTGGFNGSGCSFADLSRSFTKQHSTPTNWQASCPSPPMSSEMKVVAPPPSDFARARPARPGRQLLAWTEAGNGDNRGLPRLDPRASSPEPVHKQSQKEDFHLPSIHGR